MGPPLVAVAVNVTAVPAQTIPGALETIEMVGVVCGITVKTSALLVTAAGKAQADELVS